MCEGQGIVMRMNLTFRFFGCKTRDSRVSNETVQKQGSFSSLLFMHDFQRNLRCGVRSQHSKTAAIPLVSTYNVLEVMLMTNSQTFG